MKKIFTILTVVTLTTTMAFAQTQWGATAGLNMANVSGSDLSDAFEMQAAINGMDVNVPEMRLGIRLGISNSKELSDVMTLNSGIIYSVKGYSGSMGIPGAMLDFDQSFNYIELPVNLAFSVADQFSLMGGFYSAFLVGTTLTVDGQDEDVDIDDFTTIDVGIGLGAQFSVNDDISINAGYQMGLIALDEDGETDSKISNLLIGMTYNFGGGY
mgnify:CR=1 FL=1